MSNFTSTTLCKNCYLNSNSDKVLNDALETGIELGRSYGLLEAHNFLIQNGFVEAAELLHESINNDEENRTTLVDA